MTLPFINNLAEWHAIIQRAKDRGAITEAVKPKRGRRIGQKDKTKRKPRATKEEMRCKAQNQ